MQTGTAMPVIFLLFGGNIVIEIKNLSKTYQSAAGEITALRDISLTINDGEIFGIIGLSGAGKSTLVRCINFLEKPTEGTVTVDGNPVNLRPKEAKILELLLREQGRTVSRDLLIERVWGTDFDGDERMIDRHIASLRKALGTASQHIRAVYGKGYRLGGST